MSEIEQMREALEAVNRKLDVLVESLGGVGKALSVKAVGLDELGQLLAVGSRVPCKRTVKDWTRKHRASLHRITQKPVSFSRASVMDTLAGIHAGKKAVVKHGGQRL